MCHTSQTFDYHNAGISKKNIAQSMVIPNVCPPTIIYEITISLANSPELM
jgi:hypothetical protein